MWPILRPVNTWKPSKRSGSAIPSRPSADVSAIIPVKSGAAAESSTTPVAIKALKRFVADWYFENIAQLPPPEPFQVLYPQKIAVIGAGPCGLSCAYFLAQMGYPVTVFEALPVGGGMLSVAIPDFRLPQEVIDQEINYIIRRGWRLDTTLRLISTLPLKT